MNLLNSKNKTKKQKKKSAYFQKSHSQHSGEIYICYELQTDKLMVLRHLFQSFTEIPTTLCVMRYCVNTPLPAPILNRVLIKGPNVNPMETTNVLIQARKIMTYFYFLFSRRPGKEWKCILYRLCNIPLGYICVYFPANEKEEQFSNSKLLFFFPQVHL